MGIFAALQVIAPAVTLVSVLLRISAVVARISQSRRPMQLGLAIDVSLVEMRQSEPKTRRNFMVPSDYRTNVVVRRRYWLQQGIFNGLALLLVAVAAVSLSIPTTSLIVWLTYVVCVLGAFYFMVPILRLTKAPWRSPFAGSVAELTVAGSIDEVCQLAYSIAIHCGFRVIQVGRNEEMGDDECRVDGDTPTVSVAIRAVRGYYWLGAFIGQNIVITIGRGSASGTTKIAVSSEAIIPDLADSPRIDEKNLQKFLDGWAIYPHAVNSRLESRLD